MKFIWRWLKALWPRETLVLPTYKKWFDMIKDGKMLTLPIKKKWFDMILAGIKKEEYREIKWYWIKRLSSKPKLLKLINGYGKNAPYLIIECTDVRHGWGKPEWGAPKEMVIVFKLGKIVEAKV